MHLKAFRNQLDLIDDQILDLLAQRAEIVQKIGELKAGTGEENVYVPHREKEIIARLKAKNKGVFPADALETIYTEVISACRSLEKPLEIAFLGPVGSFGHAACLRHFGSSAELIPIVDQADIFKEVEAGRADYGVVAIENSTNGTVRDVLEMFEHTTLQICAEVFLPIDQNLLSKERLADITKVYSHPQPFAQCREWLGKSLRGVEQVEVASTSEAASLAAGERGASAIASRLAADIYKLSIVGESIMDDTNNTTRFLVVGHHPAGKSGRDRTSIFVAIKDRIGALCQVLSIFQSHKINMSKIESLPARTKAWEYVFFIDLEGHLEDSSIRTALAQVEALSVHAKTLGSYTRGT